jgi:hypothetical protein
MNSLPKLVFSATLAEPLAWNNAQLAKRAPVEEINAGAGAGPDGGQPLTEIAYLIEPSALRARHGLEAHRIPGRNTPR